MMMMTMILFDFAVDLRLTFPRKSLRHVSAERAAPIAMLSYTLSYMLNIRSLMAL